ncbi:tetratricopeptide repeat protein [Asticcacaulis sp. AND118]|uniref:tetratricopeptide repeat protein n=1 Tax=Asticcacaulis sp. AND118 TaxID=2840468 RepID=UPI001CFF5A8B|nr:tetratricopeptide repeat protein [Asticcacaulis sp. AND118]UDF02831.1 tetratricopeptide repeat protein [Asticcacaulis sp. AND118]
MTRQSLKATLSALTIVVATAASLSMVAPAPAHAQLFSIDQDEADDKSPPVEWDKKRLERLDRNVRKLERAITNYEGKTGKNAGPPALIEPDPEVVALQATVEILSRKVDEQAQQITQLTSQVEESGFAARQANEKIVGLEARIGTLIQRLDLVEAHLNDVDAALAGPPPPPPTTGTAEGDFNQAYDLLTNGNMDDAERAFTEFTTKWGAAPQSAEAWFRLGQIRTVKGDVSGSVAAYATSLKGWPKTTWAPEATVKLATALSQTDAAKSCVALAEFNKRYATGASAAIKSQAKALATKGKCA